MCFDYCVLSLTFDTIILKLLVNNSGTGKEIMMWTYANLGREFSLKLFSKKLSSGNYQIRFQASLPEDKNLYGYMLVQPGTTLKSVVQRIMAKLKKAHRSDFQQEHLYALGSRASDELKNILVFEN